ncbi:MAG: PEP-CTERM sorting domain-containing protein [Akkermansia sp.]|nr:PEP-CTERM sorting domain-containing protein [Akkermansia sp.]
MKLYLYRTLRRAVVMLTASGSCVFAADAVIKAPINQTGEYSERYFHSNPTTVEYVSIKSDGVRIDSVKNGTGAVNLSFGSIDAGENRVAISTYIGDIALGDVNAGYINVSTNKGNITITGSVQASSEGSAISISGGDAAGGSFILDNASLSNVGLSNQWFDESYNIIYDGTVSISGNTTLTDVYFAAGSVEVAAGASLVLDNVLFTTIENSNNGRPADTGLVLGDNVTLSLNAGETLNIKELIVGSGVDIILTLSNAEFLTLDNREFNIFSVENGEIDFSDVNFTFTDGEQYKRGTISATGGTISVTGSQIITVPEPTTATLSLLALCGLAARRRRK